MSISRPPKRKRSKKHVAHPQHILCSQCACCGIKIVDAADFLVVGAGAAGSVVAARLAEDCNNTVLVLEAGPNNLPELLTGADRDAIAVPALSGLLYSNPLLPGASPSDLAYVSTPTHPSGTRFSLRRGTGAGGSVSHHGMVDGRGSRVVYDNIAKITNAKQWSYAAMLPIFKEMEMYNVPDANPKYHGHCGWLSINEPGAEDGFSPDVIKTSQEVLGTPFQPDMNGNPHQAAGVGFVTAQVTPAGERSYAARDLLITPKLVGQGNLRFGFNNVVARILFDSNAGSPQEKTDTKKLPKAIGVLALRGRRLLQVDDAHENGTPFEQVVYLARREVILAGGTINSPQTLLLSGIGPRKHLEKFKIPIVVDNPSVGSHMCDHLEVGLVHQIDPCSVIWRYQACIALNNLRMQVASIVDQGDPKFAPCPATSTTNSRNAMCPASAQGASKSKSQPQSSGNVNAEQLLDKLADIEPQLKKYCNPAGLTGNGFDVQIDWYGSKKSQELDQKLHPHSPFPDFHAISSLFYFKTFDIQASIQPISAQFVPTNPDFLSVFHTWIIENLKIERFDGTVRLQSTDPTVPPLIDEALGNDKAAIRRCARGIQLMRKIMQNKRMQRYVVREVLPGPEVQTLDQLEAYIRQESLYGHHFAGTCGMEKVVSGHTLEVFGVRGLRVVDLSIIPSPHLFAFNPSRGVYAFAEQAARIIQNKVRF